MIENPKGNQCVICETPNNFDVGTISLKGKLICASCVNELVSFEISYRKAEAY